MQIIKRAGGLFLSIVLLAMAVLAAVPAVSAQTTGTAYYVDAVAGDDSNAGTSESAAWKTLSKVNATTFSAGDTIYLKAGSTWNEVLYPKGSGTAGAPITVTSYGEGSQPMINGRQDASACPVNTAVYLSNQDYITIQGLELTNNSNTTETKYIVKIDPRDGYTMRGIVIADNYIHGVSGGWNRDTHAGLKGINAWSESWWGYFDGLTVEGNTVEDVKSVGIEINGSYQGGDSNGNANENAAKNVVVRNNYLSNIGADGILVNNCNEPLVEYNTCNKAHSYSDAYNVAIWPFACRNALLQYNEAFNTQTTKDGHGFDSDYQCTGTTFQYNYSHDNQGGFMLICTEPQTWDGHPAFNRNTVVRYNISQNDHTVIFALTGHIDNTKVYNNTIYIADGLDTDIVTTYVRDGWTGQQYAPNNTQFYNNIIYNLGSGEYSFSYKNLTCRNTVWSNNLFYGNHPDSEPEDAHKITADPLFINAGGAAQGRNTCVAYQLQDGSPALQAGMVIADNGGQDFFGNPVPAQAAPDLGACQRTGVPEPEYMQGDVTGDGVINNKDLARLKAYLADDAVEMVVEAADVAGTDGVLDGHISNKDYARIKAYLADDTVAFDQ